MFSIEFNLNFFILAIQLEVMKRVMNFKKMSCFMQYWELTRGYSMY